MALFWFLAGVLTTLASLVCCCRGCARFLASVRCPQFPGRWPRCRRSVCALALRSVPLARAPGACESADPPAAHNDFRRCGVIQCDSIRSASGGELTPPHRAGSMSSAIAALEARLAKGGGSADDWELLAKSYEFLGRPDDASKARAQELPPLPIDANACPAECSRGRRRRLSAEQPGSAHADLVRRLAQAARQGKQRAPRQKDERGRSHLCATCRARPDDRR